MNKAYRLKVDNSQIVDDFPNIHKIKQEDYLDLSHLLASEKHELTENEIIARANFDQITKYDFIQNEFGIPVLSNRFIDLLNLYDDKELKLVPVILLDDIIPPNKIYKTFGKGIKKDVPINTDFNTVKFNKQFDYCDLEKSSFRKLRSQPDSLGILKQVVLKEPKNGFPSLFRIKESISMLFVSGEAKEALESNGIKGCLFDEVEVTPYNS